MSDIEFPTTLYVAVQELKKLDTNTYPLSFLTPYGTDSAFNKRRATADQWAGRGRSYATGNQDDYEGNVLPNEPQLGFAVEKAVSRYSTSNKLFRITDPRGFKVEISSENLCALLLETTMIKGVFQEKLVWGRVSGTNYLVTENDPVYVESLKPKEAYVPQPGDMIQTFQHGEAQYIGTYFVHIIEQETTYPQGRYVYNYGGNNYQSQAIHTYVEKIDKKPWKVYRRTNYKNKMEYVLTRDFGKHKVISKNNLYPPTEFGKYVGYNYHEVIAVFETLADLNTYKAKDLKQTYVDSVRVTL